MFVDIILVVILILVNFLCIIYSIFLVAVVHGSVYGSPYVPSNKITAKKMLQLAEIKRGEKVFDLGCGDGRLVFASADQGAMAVGIEISFFVYLLARLRQYFNKKNVKIVRGNIFEQDLKDADVVFCYLLPGLMKKLTHKFKKDLKKGARIVSHGFKLPGFEPIKSFQYDKKKKRGSIFVYTV